MQEDTNIVVYWGERGAKIIKITEPFWEKIKTKSWIFR